MGLYSDNAHGWSASVDWIVYEVISLCKTDAVCFLLLWSYRTCESYIGYSLVFRDFILSNKVERVASHNVFISLR